MTIREKIKAVRKVQGCRVEIANRLKEIIEDTYDYHCRGIKDFMIGDDSIFVEYNWTCHGETEVDDVTIPIEWLDKGFDYRKAYEENMRKAEEEARKRIEAEQKKGADRKAKEEYKKYLELKKKYEGGN